ncbi:hypothetical protein V5799_012877 [Amblyomma americanum]|uniref:Retrotransposon gag domain-containing protein n=1 Tax=Amblyomma americanum TaxID=6943 RepID=A0AAQ4DSZ4_AMBAM
MYVARHSGSASLLSATKYWRRGRDHHPVGLQETTSSGPGGEETGRMAMSGRFDQFIEDGDEDIESYVERFDHFLKASKVSDDLEVSVFITATGKKAYKTVKTLLEPEKPESKTYAQLVRTLREQYVQKSSVIADRFNLNRRFQQEGETVAAFAVELKRLAASCDFGTLLDEALRERFVAGLCDKEMQAELLKESKLTF